VGDAAVIGAGVLGLAVAQRLRERGESVTVFEGAATVGGLASAWEIDGTAWDRHHHIISSADTRTRQLLRSVDLEREVRWVRATRAIHGGPGRPAQPISSVSDIVRMSNLRATDKARLAATIAVGTRRQAREPADELSVERWLTRWSGRRTFQELWLPLLRAKMGDEWRNAAAPFLWATLERMHTARGSFLRSERLGYVPGGYARVVERYAAALNDAGVKIHVSAPVRRVRRAGAGLQVQLADGSETFDRVVVTTAAPLAADLCAEALQPAEQSRLRAVRYAGVISASLLLDHELSPYCLTYLADGASPFTAVVNMGELNGLSRRGGWSPVYLVRYVSPDQMLYGVTDERLRQDFLAYLHRMYPHLARADIGAFKVSRERHAVAVPTPDYCRSMPPTTTSVPGLQLIGSANLPLASLNVNDTLSLVQELR
jgi:protoporphyrinogen oxidase